MQSIDCIARDDFPSARLSLADLCPHIALLRFVVRMY